jgi:hypothetical protein
VEDILLALSPATQDKAREIAAKMGQHATAKGDGASKYRKALELLAEVQTLPETILAMERDIQDGANELAALILADIAAKLAESR